MALNRLLAFLGACALALALFLVLRHTRFGAALRAITIDPVAASIVGVDVRRYSALAFAAGGALAATSGMLVSTFISFSATTGVEYTLKALIVVIMAGVGRVTGTLAAGLLLGVVEVARRLSGRSRPDHRHQLQPVHAGAAAAADGAVHPCLSCWQELARRGARSRWRALALALLPRRVPPATCSRSSSLLYANVALSTAWAFFSGTTRYISLATAAFFGVGIYALAIPHVYVPVPLALLLAAVVGFLVALVVGLSTLRLRGVYFVVFTFGLTELVHQVINWWEIKINRTVSRYIFTDVSNVSIYETLLAVALLTIVGQLVREPHPARLSPCAPSARTRRWRGTPASTPRASRCCALPSRPP